MPVEAELGQTEMDKQCRQFHAGATAIDILRLGLERNQAFAATL
jgi:hypothetical protein